MLQAQLVHEKSIGSLMWQAEKVLLKMLTRYICRSDVCTTFGGFRKRAVGEKYLYSA